MIVLIYSYIDEKKYFINTQTKNKEQKTKQKNGNETKHTEKRNRDIVIFTIIWKNFCYKKSGKMNRKKNI